MCGDATNWDEDAYRETVLREREIQTRTVFRTAWAPPYTSNLDTLLVASSDGSVASYSISSSVVASKLKNVRIVSIPSFFLFFLVQFKCIPNQFCLLSTIISLHAPLAVYFFPILMVKLAFLISLFLHFLFVAAIRFCQCRYRWVRLPSQNLCLINYLLVLGLNRVSCAMLLV